MVVICPKCQKPCRVYFEPKIKTRKNIKWKYIDDVTADDLKYLDEVKQIEVADKIRYSDYDPNERIRIEHADKVISYIRFRTRHGRKWCDSKDLDDHRGGLSPQTTAPEIISEYNLNPSFTPDVFKALIKLRRLEHDYYVECGIGCTFRPSELRVVTYMGH